MKSLFLATAAVAAFVAAPAFAQDSVGSIGLTYGNTSVDVAGFDGDVENVALDAKVAVVVAPEWTVTVDGAFTYKLDGLAGTDNSNIDGTIHLSRSFGDFRVAGFTGGTQIGSETLWAFGAQGQAYLMDNLTLTGAVTYEKLDGFDVDAWSFGADAAYFINPALRVNGGLSYSTIDLGGPDTDAWSANVGGEYQIANTPLSVTANYTYADLKDADLTVDTFTIGFRYSFGGDLKARDRSGADLGRAVPGINTVASIFAVTPTPVP